MNIPEKQRSLPLTEYLHSKASWALVPLSGTFELSPVCNFSCRMCYVRKTAEEVRQSSRKILTLEQWLQIAREAREAGMLYLLLTGGEPFLWPDFWTLYEELIYMGFIISINTNGSLIDDEAIERLKRLPPRKINITLYGASDETYERLCGAKNMFSKVDHAINALCEAGIVVKLNCSLTPHNVCDLEAMTTYAKDRKLILDVASYMFPPIRRDPDMIGINDRFTPEEAAKYRLEAYRLLTTPEENREYLEKVVKGTIDPPGLDEGCVDPIDGRIRCRAGKATFWVTWDGWLTPCGMMPEPKVDLPQMTFRDAWKEVTHLSAELALSGVCKQCANQDLCHPCAAIAYAETGTSTGIPRYLCEESRNMQIIARQQLGLK